MQEPIYSWVVVRKRELDPPEVYTFQDEEEAREFYTRAKAQWSDTFLCRVIEGPLV